MAFVLTNPTSIANITCQKIGAELIAPGALQTEDSKQAQQISAAWDFYRRAELQRNPWVFGIRYATLRPLTLNTKQITFGNYASGSTYVQNDIVVDPTDGQIYQSNVANNLGNTPSASPTQWSLYIGPIYSTEFVCTWISTITYNVNDHAVGSDGQVYISIVANNSNHNPVGDAGVHWVVDSSGYSSATTVTFFAGEFVHIGNSLFLSLYNSNGQGTNNNPPFNTINGLPPPNTTSWLQMTTAPTIAIFNFNYPVGAGPSQDFATNNVYMLPAGFLSRVQQDPKAGQALFLGAPDGAPFKDWVFGGASPNMPGTAQYYTTNDSGPTVFRFMADIQDVTMWDHMFKVGFACRLGIELCEIITQSTTKKNGLEVDYKLFMYEARLKNAIENGPTYPEEDSYITCRI